MNSVAQTLDVFCTRLVSLKHIVERAENELCKSDPEKKEILTARIHAEMLPFPYQVSFTCRQAELLISKLNNEPVREFESESASFQGLKTVIDETITRIKAQSAEEAFASAETILEIPNLPPLSMSGHDYIHEWLMPNFYFHLVTAYDILRAQGLALGKADYMRHLGPRIETAMATNS